MQMNKFEEKARDFLIGSKEEALEQGNLPGVGEGV